MADFKTHITVSTGLGIAYGTMGYLSYGLPFEHCMIAAGLCSVSGMMPDLDSKSSVPHREMLTLMSALTPILMLPRFEELQMTKEQIVFATGFIYLFVRFVIGGIFNRYTVHRGMWHSIPAAVIAGLATYLLCHCSNFEIRLFKAWAVVLGFVSHLILDEIYAVNWEGKRINLKRSFGTALKLTGPSRSANLFTYGKLCLLLMLIFGDRYAMNTLVENLETTNIQQTANDWFNRITNPSQAADDPIYR